MLRLLTCEDLSGMVIMKMREKKKTLGRRRNTGRQNRECGQI